VVHLHAEKLSVSSNSEVSVQLKIVSTLKQAINHPNTSPDLFKPAKILCSEILCYVGKLLGNPRLLKTAVNLDPINLRAKLYLLQRNRISRDTYYQILFETFEMVKHIETGLRPLAQHQPSILTNWPKSHSQFYQDLFVLSEHRFKREGFFVEVGVGNGKDISNTFLLEKEFGWRGILAEPNQRFASSIKAYRRAALDQRAVFSKTGLELDFLVDETEGELSTLADFKDKDQRLRRGEIFKARTVTLNELLTQYQAPKNIDYISIDTEGSELEILQAFDFSKHSVSIFTVEHNFEKEKLAKLQRLMRSNGFTQVAPEVSKWDAWFVSKTTCSA
jgi:FkbM family methyltransferase